jgi:hypothetical protein
MKTWGWGLLDQRPTKPQFIRLKPNETRKLIILSRRCFSAWTHFNGSTEKPCLRERCTFDHEKNPPRLHVWLHVWDRKEKREYILQLGASCVEQMKRIIDRWGNLRGLEIAVTLKNPNRRFEVNVAALDRWTGELPDEFNLYDYFLSCWKVTELDVEKETLE